MVVILTGIHHGEHHWNCTSIATCEGRSPTVTQHISVIHGEKVIPTCDVYRLTFNDSNAKKLAAYLYYTDHNISMFRKSQLAVAVSQGFEPQSES